MSWIYRRLRIRKPSHPSLSPLIEGISLEFCRETYHATLASFNKSCMILASVVLSLLSSQMATTNILSIYYSATALLAMQSAVIATAIPSVRRLSVRLSHAGTLSRRMEVGSCGLHGAVAKHSSFMTPRLVGERRSLPPKICAQSDPTPLKSADFDQYLLITSKP